MAYDGPKRVRLGFALKMSKKYEIVRDKMPVPGGGFIEAFRMALVDLSCFGERHLDLTGYPQEHESEAAAMMSDWAALGADFRNVADKVISEDGADENGGRTARGIGAAADK
jgi:hypothetical protein